MRLACHDHKIVAIGSYASANSDRTSEVVDTAGFSCCLITVHFAAIATGAVTTMKLQHADAASNETTLTSGADIEGSSQTIADDDDNQVKFWDVRPTKRYLQVAIDKDATNVTAESMLAILYGANVKPTTQGLGTSTIGEGTGAVEGEAIVNAVSGTA